ncbi:MAG: TPM domain-containing protein [Oscillospiraceae bacterium]
MKIKKIFIALVCIITCFNITISAMEAPTTLFYVADYANVMSDETEKFVIEQSAALEKLSGAQIVVATVKSLNGNSIEDYGLQMLREWKIGSEKNDGVLILVSTGDRKIGVSVGYGLEGALNDAKVGRLIDSCAIPSLKDDDYNA